MILWDFTLSYEICMIGLQVCYWAVVDSTVMVQCTGLKLQMHTASLLHLQYNFQILLHCLCKTNQHVTCWQQQCLAMLKKLQKKVAEKSWEVRHLKLTFFTFFLLQNI